jgi:hypothetical protein
MVRDLADRSQVSHQSGGVSHLQHRVRMANLIKEPIIAYATKNWIFWRNMWWPNGSHRGVGLSLRLEEGPFSCHRHHFLLGAADTRASKSDKLGAPATPAGDGGF